MITHKSTGLEFKTKPWKHQFDALVFLLSHVHGALYTDPGSGKSKVMVDLIHNAKFKKVLIVAPKHVCQVWPSQFTKHGLNQSEYDVFDLSTRSVDSASGVVKKSKNCLGRSIIFVVNYDRVWREPLKRRLLAVKWDAVICDESHRIKAPGSRCSWALSALRDRAAHRYLMTGTPLAQNPTDIYAQYRFLDPSIFGTRYDDFCARYQNVDVFVSQKVGFTVLRKDDPYVNLQELHDKMFSVAFSCKVDLSLPGQHYIDVEYPASSKVQQRYNKLIDTSVIETSRGTLTANNALALMLRLQQILSGYLVVEDDDGQKHTQIIDRRRVETLQELLMSLGAEPVVLFLKFKQDFKLIKAMLSANNWSFSELSGSTDTLQRWLEGKTQMLLVQHQSGSEGVDFTRSRYVVYYSHHHSLALYKQSLKRVHRPGQDHAVTYYSIIAKRKKGRSIDELIRLAHERNDDIIQSILRGEIE